MSDYSFPKSARLRSRRDFLRFRTDSKKFIGEALVIRYRRGTHISPRLGITVKKSLGKAHSRNLFKRKTREAFRYITHALAPGVEISIMPKGVIDTLPLDTIEKDLSRFAAYDASKNAVL